MYCGNFTFSGDLTILYSVLSQEHIFQTYRSIKFHPDMFADYLMSREVGFTSCEQLRPHSRPCVGKQHHHHTYVMIMIFNE